MAKKGLNSIIKKNKLTAEEIFYIDIDDALEYFKSGESLLSDTDRDKLHNCLIRTPEEIKKYNKLCAHSGVYPSAFKMIAFAKSYFTEAESRLKTLMLYQNEDRIKKNFLDIINNYFPKVITEAQLEDEKKRRIKEHLSRESDLDEVIFQRLRWIIETTDYSSPDGKQSLWDYWDWEDKRSENITNVKKDYPDLLNTALQDLKKTFLEKQIPIKIKAYKIKNEDGSYTNTEEKLITEYDNIDLDLENTFIRIDNKGEEICTILPFLMEYFEIKDKDLYNSGLPEHKERIEDIFNEKGYYPDEYIQGIAIYKPYKDDPNLDENGNYKDNINFYTDMLELKLTGVSSMAVKEKNASMQDVILDKVTEFLKQGYIYYHTCRIFSEKVKRPLLIKEAEDAKSSFETQTVLFLQTIPDYEPFLKKYNITIDNIDTAFNMTVKNYMKEVFMFKSAYPSESRIKKAEDYSSKTELPELNLKQIAEILGA